MAKIFRLLLVLVLSINIFVGLFDNVSAQTIKISSDELKKQFQTSMKAMFTLDINTNKMNVGDKITAQLTDDFVIDSKKIADEGSLVYGTVVKYIPSKQYQNDANVEINFNQIYTTKGKTINIQTNNVILNSKDFYNSKNIDNIKDLFMNAMSYNSVSTYPGSDLLIRAGTKFEIMVKNKKVLYHSFIK